MRTRVRRKRLGKRGISLIEIILVVAIIGVLGSIVGGSYVMQYNAYARECVSNIDAILSRMRMDSLTRQGELCLEIYKGTDGVYAKQTLVSGSERLVLSEERIGKRQVELRYTTEPAGAGSVAVTESERIYIAYARSTGAFRSLGRAKRILDGVSADNSVYCKTIEVASGGKVLTVTLFPATGRHKSG